MGALHRHPLAAPLQVLPFVALVCRDVCAGQPQVVEHKAKQHDTYRVEAEAKPHQGGVLLYRPPDGVRVRHAHHTELWVAHKHVVKLLVLDNGDENVCEEYTPIDANEGVREEEEDEPTDVVQPDTVVDPGAVVVKTRDASVAHGAVLAPRSPRDEACGALLLFVYVTVVGVTGALLRGVGPRDPPRVAERAHEEAEEAHSQYDKGVRLVVRADAPGHLGAEGDVGEGLGDEYGETAGNEE
mmetsp:Transcript_32939/g.76959  ORF Transcript_32939/g.76959 Transcript_32939/m.76959 type:complete len:241 (-) Transcript_32939:311-1033(-)